MAEEVQPSSSKLDVAVRLLMEKVTREFDLTPEEAQKAVITIKNGEVTVKKGK